ncbi:aminoglycoside phosphotransferase family protein [Pseudomonadales bacterium]|nr:aminoglycoside phosphotransferase family protein [Pseudomonadales bacterium]MDB0050371.1 aminoglycoside phosphotransferase family protein [Pseudomonadales bacterium]MDB2594773.1 aminoglycoside phosphotransferase family protein [Pseudomonadales bacterium]MDB2645430.1 aminoglycoside phosphotransferase family protein [Pseudomonadales bacterium]
MSQIEVLQRAYEVSAQWFDQVTLAPLGNGHIHHTFLLTTAQHQEQFVLQRVSENVFPDPHLVQRQTQRITEHLLNNDGFSNRYRVPKLQPSKTGEFHHVAESGFWRLWQYFANTQVVESFEQPTQIALTARAFADYQRVLANLPGQPLSETIEGFLQLDFYLQQFSQVAKDAPKDLMNAVAHLQNQESGFSEFNAHVHADCKVNNLLFNAQGTRVAAVIDLDTTMYGHWAWDFGDLMRSIAFSRGRADLVDYENAAEGFLLGLQKPVTEQTVQDMVQVPGHIAGMLGLRFLTDHLVGDVYFRVSEAGQNLQRAREQFALMEQFNDMAQAMEAVVKNLGEQLPS